MELGEAPEIGSACFDASALPRLVELHADFVWRSLRRLGVPASAVDDGAQQVFLTLQSKIEQVIVGRERAFLFSVAIHVAAHARRSLARRREVFDESALDSIDPRPGPDARLDEERARAILDAILDSMSDELRTVFVMSEVEEMTMAEIAFAIGIPPGTVASRLRRAREEFAAAARRFRARLAGPPPGLRRDEGLQVTPEGGRS